MKRIWQTLYCKLLLTAVLLIAHNFVLTTVATPIVCTQCGYESEDVATSCSHCQAEFSAPVPAPTNTMPSEPVDEFALLAVKSVEAEVATGRHHYAKGNIGVAYLFLRNAAAMSLVVDSAANSHPSANLVAEQNRFWKKIAEGNVTCPVCAGKGKTKESTVSTMGQSSLFPKTCSKCRGSGKLERPATVNELKIAVGTAVRTYEALQRARRSTQLGGAWVPEEWLPHLNDEQQLILRQATAAPCSYCASTGQDDCTKCGNNGRIKCSNGKCINGMVALSSTANSSASLSQQTKVKCTVCEGAAEILCTTCNGKGTITCKRCDGSGQRDICKTCQGDGEADCSQCKGTGQWKDSDCVKCKHTGHVICPKCSGDGKKPD